MKITRAQPSANPNESEAARSRAKKIDVNSTQFCRAVENLKVITENGYSATVFHFFWGIHAIAATSTPGKKKRKKQDWLPFCG